ncbi:MAG: PDZ domain-containing protein, partial [Desulfobacterales bacterium]|nr:PDZ domain-containing protein [Desulfobacterales bacterium]
GIRGLVVTQIKPGTLAARSGVRIGDLLVEINHKKIKSIGDYTKTLKKIDKGDTAHMLFRRGNSQVFVVRFVKE